jgi:hypothetical protein
MFLSYTGVQTGQYHSSSFTLRVYNQNLICDLQNDPVCVSVYAPEFSLSPSPHQVRIEEVKEFMRPSFLRSGTLV